MVVGAGRGPLVRRALSASSRAGRPIKVYALEKNPNAVLTLHGLMEMEWADKVGKMFYIFHIMHFFWRK